ncbi:MAG: aldehyde dehydrogenase family protein [Candidatus Thermoplasmatota archaeon]|jgi:acyl-CoA reductase-like NAD-dependent aldehyde dehydrogenase|nr:aldehyde dehydrogenase family protein [Candidatus Thermoplasmatota archaeon]MCL5790532.1 aldehyde dehydrogenase family protein [Candidatus Thermoplasmatota archaeon]
MEIETVNPFDMKVIGKFREHSEEDIRDIFNQVRKNQPDWGKSIDERISYLRNSLIPTLKRERDSLARLMSSEMGKTISQSRAEIDKCILMTQYFADNGGKFLSDDIIETEADRSFVRFEPIGVVFLIMPWNFPLWQAMRAAIPAMVAGNGIVLKHASIVTGTAVKMEEIFNTPLFRIIRAGGSRALSAIKYCDGVSFTGSTNAGSQIAAEAGKQVKKSVLELGGSDPFIVLEDCDIEKTALQARNGRLQNNGQSCIASKRFIVDSRISEQFYEALKSQFEKVTIGNQLDEKTYLGPLSSKSQADTVKKQITELSGIGKVESYGEESGNIIPPTIVKTESSYGEEVFGPVAIMKTFDSVEEAARIANETQFGLGASIWGSMESAEKMIPKIRSGMIFVNRIVASDARLPFGGVKKSGYGRELSKFGILEFTNIRTVWMQRTP